MVIWQYGFTEMFNNALVHAQAGTIAVDFTKTAAGSVVIIRDDGVGIFRKAHAALGLLDERHAVLELAKAKRLIVRFEKFRTVVLVFKGVTLIGQAFADEVFRVFALAQPEVELISLNANKEVSKMIAHVLAANL